MLSKREIRLAGVCLAGLGLALVASCERPRHQRQVAVESAATEGSTLTASSGSDGGKAASVEPGHQRDGLRRPGAERGGGTLSQSAAIDQRPAQPVIDQRRATPAARQRWQFESPWGQLPVEVWVPEHLPADRFGMLITFHGLGESRKGPQRGVKGWLDDYRLLASVERLHEPPLTSEDFQGFIGGDRLRRLNRAISERPYQDLVLVTPYLPDILRGDEAFRNGPELGRRLVSDLIPRLSERLPVNGRIGLDGVSLGGRVALLIGLTQPNAFRLLGAMQAAVDEKELDRFTQLAQAAVAKNPGLGLRLLSSDQDYYLEVNRSLSSRWTRAGVPHVFEVVGGTHSYQFNRGPGAIEMLLFHSRALSPD